MKLRKTNQGAILYISLLILSALSAISVVALQRSVLQIKMIANMHKDLELDAMVLNIVKELNNSISPHSDFQKIEDTAKSMNTNFELVDIPLPEVINEKYSSYFKNIHIQGQYRLETNPYYLKNKSGCGGSCSAAHLIIEVDAISMDERPSQQYLGLRLLHPNQSLE